MRPNTPYRDISRSALLLEFSPCSTTSRKMQHHFHDWQFASKLELSLSGDWSTHVFGHGNGGSGRPRTPRSSPSIMTVT